MFSSLGNCNKPLSRVACLIYFKLLEDKYQGLYHKFRQLWNSLRIGLHTQLFKKVNVLRGRDLLYFSILNKWADYFLRWFSPFTYRMFNWLSLANTLSGNDCNLLNDKSLWKDEKNEVIYKKIYAQAQRETHLTLYILTNWSLDIS